MHTPGSCVQLCAADGAARADASTSQEIPKIASSSPGAGRELNNFVLTVSERTNPGGTLTADL